MSVLLKACVFVFVLLGFIQESKAYTCWEPFKTTPGVELEDRDSGGKNKKSYSKYSRESTGKGQGKAHPKAQGKYTTSSGQCGNDDPPPTPGKPGTPSVSVKNSTSGTYTVSWSAASNMVSSGSEAYGYEVLEYKNGNYVKKYATSPTTRSKTISNNPDGNYRYKVRGCNLNFNMGVPVCGNYSSLSSTNYVRHKPSKAQAPTVADTSITNGKVSISWNKPSGTVTEYDVIEYKSGVGGYKVVANNTTAKSLSLSGRSNGDYTYRVRACNDFSWACAVYSSYSATAKVRYPPSKPSNFSPLSSESTGSVQLSWNKPSGTINHYRIQKRNNGGSWSKVDYSHPNTSIIASGLSDGSWDFRVKSCNDYYWACSGYSYSSKVTVRLKPVVPAAPDVSPSQSPNGEIDVSWDKPSGTVTKYDVIEYLFGSRVDGETVGDTAFTSALLVNKLDGDYTYRVRACNEFDWACSNYSNHSDTVVVNHPTPDTPPSIVVPGLVTRDNYTISWGASVSPYAEIYEIDQKHDSGSWEGWVSVSGTSSQITVDKSGLWTHRVRACNVLPDNSRKCSSPRVSSEVDVKLPPDWARLAGNVADKTYGHDEGLISDETVGAVEGSGGVSGGAATYSIPIVIPPGRKGMQPNVSLSYSSRSGNGIAGVGWSISAGSAISRCSATAAQDTYSKGVTYGSDDKLCLDGQRLIVVNGSYGASGAEYRTELDTFAKIVQSGSMDSSSSSFTVYQKNNRVAEYGSTTSSKHKASGRDEVLSWAIANIQDPSGNTISYDYYNYSNGENLLKTIYYTGRDGANGDREVHFKYGTDARPDIRRSYMAGGLTTSSKRLEKIQTVYQSQVIREYKLGYDISGFTQRSILKDITECVGVTCLSPTTVSTYSPGYSWDLNDSSSSSNRLISDIGEGVGSGDWIDYVDLNGDGILEVMHVQQEKLSSGELDSVTNIYKREGGGYQPKPSLNGLYLNKGDVNLDGITDFMFMDSSSNAIKYVQFNESFNPVTSSANVAIPELRPATFNLLSQLDVNNDGYTDLVFTDQTADSATIKYYQRASDGSLNFTGPYLADTLRQRWINNSEVVNESVSYMDVDGDGITDLLKVFHEDDAVTELSVGFGVISSGKWDIGTTKTSTELGLPANHFLNQYFFADLNGDGLKDFVRTQKLSSSQYAWTVRVNAGDRTFKAEDDLGTAIGIHEHKLKLRNGSYVNKVQSLWGGATFADLNNDGKEELLAPTGSDDDLCAFFNGRREDFSEVQFEVCNDELHTNEPVQIDGGGSMYLDFGQYDIRRFKRSIVEFEQQANNLTVGAVESSVVNAPMNAFSDLTLSKKLSPLALKDINNDGLLDFSYRTLKEYTYNYCVEKWEGNPNDCVISIGGQSFKNPVLNVSFNAGTPAIHEGYFEQKSLIGKGAHDGRLADTVYEVENGLGVKTSWAYAPLSKHIDREHSSKDFYHVPSVNQRYVEDDPSKEHFIFTSSMYVVNSLKQSDGIGGLNETQYSYQEAVYNRMGRGFQGFRTIVVDDKAKGIRSVTDFHQIFPKAGKVESARTCLMVDNDSDCSVSPLSQTDVIYHTNNTANSTVKWVYPSNSTKKTYDLNDRYSLLSEEVTTIGDTSADVDAYGNVLKSVTTMYNGFDTVTTTKTKDFDYSYVDDWWINKVRWTKTTSQVSQGSPGGLLRAPVENGTNSDKWLKTDYSVYNVSHRMPTETVTTASGSTQSHSTTMVPNSDGLPTSVTTTGGSDVSAGSALARTVSTSYSSDGYFPETVTNEMGSVESNLSSTTLVSAVHGQPLSVTDANGVTVTHTYDVFGRLQSSTVPGGKLIEKGYNVCNSGCPTNAEYFEFTQQVGSPTVKVYKDMFNRPVMTETTGFGGALVFTRVEYDTLGRKTRETVPSYDDTSTKGTYYKHYDVLGRLTEKWVDQADSRKMITTYAYQGHTTSISATDGRTLNMSRTYGTDGKLIQTTDAMGGVTRYAYDSMGNPITLQDANNNAIYAWHNGFGHKEKVDDPNMGVKTFVYNTYGEVEKETDANGDSLTMRYDGLGRLTQRKVNGAEQAAFEYDTATNGKGLLASETSGDITKHYTYDGKSRPKTVTTSIDNTPYTTITEYDDNFGRVKALTYPGSEIKVAYGYDVYGYQTTTYNAKSGYIYQSVEARDARFNIKKAFKNYSSGNDDNKLIETRTHSATTGQVGLISVDKAFGGGTPLHSISYEYEGFGNLDTVTQRHPSGSTTETYVYDDLHRLTQSQRDNGTTISYGYDAVGNITQKTDYATNFLYTGSGGPNAVSSVDKLNPDGSTTPVDFSYDANGNMTAGDGKILTYNAFNKPVTVEKGAIKSTFAYGADLMRYKQVKTGTGQGDITTLYLGKLVEIVKNGTTTSTKTYIDDIAIVSKDETPGQAIPDHKIRFTHRDRLGSVVTLTDHFNNITEQRNFDPFGKPRNADMSDATSPTLLGTNDNFSVFTTRGFTDHEHLDDAELIHMNGRVYDYNLGRFLSVDPFIQFVGNSQSVNPYTYILNNPLAGTDPTGYEGTGIRQEQSMMYENPEFGAELKELRIKQAEGALEAVILIDTVSDYAAPVKGIIKKGIKETAKAIIKKFKNIKSNGKDPTIKNKSGDPSKIGDNASQSTKKRNKRPDPLEEAEGRPHTIIEKKGEKGQYTTHNGDGTYKQYRGEGKKHGKGDNAIERPNVKETKKNTNPKTGESFPGKPKVRPPRKDEIPKPPKKPEEKL